MFPYDALSAVGMYQARDLDIASDRARSTYPPLQVHDWSRCTLGSCCLYHCTSLLAKTGRWVFRRNLLLATYPRRRAPRRHGNVWTA